MCCLKRVCRRSLSAGVIRHRCSLSTRVLAGARGSSEICFTHSHHTFFPLSVVLNMQQKPRPLFQLDTYWLFATLPVQPAGGSVLWSELVSLGIQSSWLVSVTDTSAPKHMLPSVCGCHLTMCAQVSTFVNIKAK